MLTRLTFLFIFILIPSLVHARGSGEGLYYAIVLIVIVGPYWLLSLLPFFIQRKNRGRSLFYSLLTYMLCIGGLTLAKYHAYGSGSPEMDFEEDIMFYLMCLPFVVVIILAAIKDYNYSKYGDA